MQLHPLKSSPRWCIISLSHMANVTEIRTNIFKTIRARRAAIERRRQEIDILRAEVVQLWRRLNTTCSISALPSEVLLLIFQEYLLCPTSSTTDADIPPHWPWLVLIQVCHIWRHLVFSSPLLWSRLDAAITQHPSIVELFILASRNAPLDVFIERHALSDMDGLNDLGEAFNRLCKKRLVYDPSLSYSTDLFSNTRFFLT